MILGHTEQTTLAEKKQLHSAVSCVQTLQRGGGEFKIYSYCFVS